MTLPYSFRIALRYLKARKRHKSLSFNTLISIGGVAVGVMALIIVLSVMSGFHADLQKKILGINSHIITLSAEGVIQSYSRISAKVAELSGVRSVSPFVIGQVMVSNGRRAQGVYLRGIEPAMEARATDIVRYIKSGNFNDLNAPGNTLVIGVELTRALDVTTGSEVNVTSPMGDIGPLGMLPKTRTYKVAALFEVGMYEYDSSLAITNLPSAQEFFDIGDTVSGLEVKLDDLDAAPEMRELINKTLGYPYHSRDWMQMNKNLFSALKLEKLAMFVILTLIVLVASFNIISTLIMNVMEKERDIAILKTMGATDWGIMLIFILQGALVGFIGTGLGLFGGSVLCWLLDTYELIKLPPDVYYLSHLPVKVNQSDFIVISVSAMTISLLSTIYPAIQAAKLNPIEPLRYE